MANKSDRLSSIRQIVAECNIGSQEDLLVALAQKGYQLTQATLSRDLKRLKITRSLTDSGEYRYILPPSTFFGSSDTPMRIIGVNSLEFSGSVAVMKTRSGYAGGIAAEIDLNATDVILGTIAGDDTILIIPREGVSRNEITKRLTELIGNN